MEKQKITSSSIIAMADGLKNDKKLFNPIGFLNEICQKNKLKLPKYNKNQEGPPHSPIFNVECIFKDLSFCATGLTIKEAREKSAIMAVENLNLMAFEKETKPSFRIVEVCPLSGESKAQVEEGIEPIWNEECSDIKITFRRKNGSCQQFKTFIFKKVSVKE
jgi:Double-stranded RNA binding motif